LKIFEQGNPTVLVLLKKDENDINEDITWNSGRLKKLVEELEE